MTLDPRINVFRADLADIRLQGSVEAKRYVPGTPAVIITPIANLRTSPNATAPVGTQALLGEELQIFETRDGWHWVQLNTDGYVGYIRAGEADTNKSSAPTHTVTAKLAHVYPTPDIKTQPLELLPMGAKFNAVGVETDTWLTLARGGYTKSAAVRPLETKDVVEIAEQFLGAPYLWGGRTALGIDCSGLIQRSCHAAGIKCMRDANQQEQTLGMPVPDGEPLRRRQVIFFKGHVGIMRDETHLVHANATSMSTIIEPLTHVIARNPITSRRQLSL